ncbi:MAG: hypothetical protein FWF85_07720, partial [Clostridiales bacterium]|nr:hypothetical protein [Clostridiales bacterium]
MHNMRRNKLAKAFIILIMVIFTINSTSALAVAMELYNGYQAEKQWQAILNAELNEAAPSLGDTADQKIEQPEVVAPIEQDSTYSLEKEESEPVDLGAVLAENEFDSTNPQAVDSPAGPAEQDWQDKGALPFSLKDFKTAESNGKLYVFGGFDTAGQVVNSVYEYDPVTNSWAAKASMPIYDQGFAVASAYGKIYLIGGVSSVTQGGANNWTSNTYEFDPMTNTWQQKAAIPSVKWDLEARFYQGKIYAIGGLDINWAVNNVVEAYDPLTNTWAAIGGMPQYIGAPYSFVNNNKLYVFDKSAPLRDAAIVFCIYDGSSWQSPTSQGLCNGNAFVNLNDTLYAIGYIGSSGSNQNICKYSIQENMWGFYNAPGNSFGRINVVNTLNNEVYIFAGANDYCTKLVKYTPKTSPWTQKNNIPVSNANRGAVVKGDTIYYAGEIIKTDEGNGRWGFNHNSFKAYNINTDTWQEKACMIGWGSNVELFETVNNRIFALYDASTSDNGYRVEVYDPETNKWSAHSTLPLEYFTISDYYSSSSLRTRDISLGTVAFPASTVYGNQIYILGGLAPGVSFRYYYNSYYYSQSYYNRYYPSAAVDTVLCYNSANWTRTASMPVAVYAAGAATLKGKIYVAGGIPNIPITDNSLDYWRKITYGSKPTDTLQIYNTVNYSWTTKNMPIALSHVEVVAGPDSIFIVGGVTSDNKILDLVY